jgi:hypothetical protein
MIRRLFSILAALAAILNLTACLASFENALTLRDGQLAVESCGSFIYEVSVLDSSDVLLWKVRAAGSEKDRRNVSRVQVGTKPPFNWTESGSIAGVSSDSIVTIVYKLDSYDPPSISHRVRLRNDRPRLGYIGEDDSSFTEGDFRKERC